MPEKNQPASVSNETIHVATGRGTANPSARSLFRPKAKTQQMSTKELVFFGNQESLHMLAVSHRRILKILSVLGSDLGHYYLWILERIYLRADTGRDDQTLFKCEEAAAAFGVNKRTIQNYNDRFRKDFPGWVTIEVTYLPQKGGKPPRQGSNRYTIHPINELINDDGWKPEKQGKKAPKKRASAGGMGETAFIHRGETSFILSGKPFVESASCDPASPNAFLRTSSPLQAPKSVSQVTSSTEAGGTVTAANAPGFQDVQPIQPARNPKDSRPAPYQGFDEDWVAQDIQPCSEFDEIAAKWVEDHASELDSLSFEFRETKDVVSDMNKGFSSDVTKLLAFIEHWPAISQKIATIAWIKNRNKPFGYGWLFCPSLKDPSETNLQAITFSSRLGGQPLPKDTYRPGQMIKYPHNFEVRTYQLIRPLASDGSSWKACRPEFYGTPEQEEAKETVFVSQFIKE